MTPTAMMLPDFEKFSDRQLAAALAREAAVAYDIVINTDTDTDTDTEVET